jgi:hypothetical protein
MFGRLIDHATRLADPFDLDALGLIGAIVAAPPAYSRLGLRSERLRSRHHRPYIDDHRTHTVGDPV